MLMIVYGKMISNTGKKAAGDEYQATFIDDTEDVEVAESGN